MWSKVTLMNRHKIQWKSIRELSLDNQNLTLFAQCDAPQHGLQLFLYRFLKDKITETFTALCSPSWAYVPEMTLIHCLHTWKGGKRWKSKLLHPEPVLSAATPSCPEWFSMPIPMTVLVFSRASGFLPKSSGGGFAASHSSITAQMGGPGHGCSPHKWACMDLELQYLLSPVSTLLPGNAYGCSLDTLPLLKALLW